MVELRDGFFIIKIRCVAQAAQQVLRTDVPRIVGCEPLKLIHAHLGLICKYLPDPGQALLQREECALLCIGADGYNHLIKQRKCPHHQIDMPLGDGIKRSGEYAYFFHWRTLFFYRQKTDGWLQ